MPKDANGTELNAGDSVSVIKDLKVYFKTRNNDKKYQTYF